jgi:hypothetical protein
MSENATVSRRAKSSQTQEPDIEQLYEQGLTSVSRSSGRKEGSWSEAEWTGYACSPLLAWALSSLVHLIRLFVAFQFEWLPCVVIWLSSGLLEGCCASFRDLVRVTRVSRRPVGLLVGAWIGGMSRPATRLLYPSTKNWMLHMLQLLPSPLFEDHLLSHPSKSSDFWPLSVGRLVSGGGYWQNWIMTHCGPPCPWLLMTDQH